MQLRQCCGYAATPLRDVVSAEARACLLLTCLGMCLACSALFVTLVCAFWNDIVHDIVARLFSAACLVTVCMACCSASGVQIYYSRQDTILARMGELLLSCQDGRAVCANGSKFGFPASAPLPASAAERRFQRHSLLASHAHASFASLSCANFSCG
jgi:hypothetical protein